MKQDQIKLYISGEPSMMKMVTGSILMIEIFYMVTSRLEIYHLAKLQTLTILNDADIDGTLTLGSLSDVETTQYNTSNISSNDTDIATNVADIATNALAYNVTNMATIKYYL